MLWLLPMPSILWPVGPHHGDQSTALQWWALALVTGPHATMTQLWHTWEYSGQDEKTTAPVIYLGTTSIIIMQCTVLAEIYISSSQNDIERTEVMAIIRFMDSDWKVIKHVVPRIADICWQFVGLSRVGVSGIWISLVMALWRPLYGVLTSGQLDGNNSNVIREQLLLSLMKKIFCCPQLWMNDAGSQVLDSRGSVLCHVQKWCLMGVYQCE